MPIALTDEQAAAFARDGFTGPVPALSVDEATACLARIDAFEAETGEEASKCLRTKAHLLLPWINNLVRHSAVLDAVEDVLGEPDYVGRDQQRIDPVRRNVERSKTQGVVDGFVTVIA